MSFQLTDLKKYLLIFFSYIASIFDFLSTLFKRFYDWDALGEFVDKWEDICAAVINRNSKWIGLLPLIVGLIFVFFVMGNGLFNWLVLAAFIFIFGVVLFGHSEEFED